jgi:hypothetical protein
VLSFSQEEEEKILAITRYYEVTKEILILGEQIDIESRTLIQPINELRNCLDHLMRVILAKFGMREGTDVDYIKTNLNKAFGHVYRAAYDALDWVTLTFKERIYIELHNYSLETINAVMPEYYSDLKPRIEKIY